MKSLEFRLKKIDKTSNYLLEEMKHNDFMREEHKTVWRGLNYFENLFVFISAINGCVSISVFSSLIGVLIGI